MELNINKKQMKEEDIDRTSKRRANIQYEKTKQKCLP